MCKREAGGEIERKRGEEKLRAQLREREKNFKVGEGYKRKEMVYMMK